MYCTYFELTVDPFDGLTPLDDSIYEGINAEIVKMKELSERYDKSCWGESSKWNSWEEDMICLSLKFPDVLFTLSGDGDDSDDKWIAYFHDGKEQFCRGETVYPEYDPDLLKPPECKVYEKYASEVKNDLFG